MNYRPKIHLFVFAATALLLAGCERTPPTIEPVDDGTQLPTVYTVNYPLQFFAQRIGGDAINVLFPGPADADPAYWSPGPEAVSAYQQADLILLNGAGYADWAKRVSLPLNTQLDTSAAITDRLLPVRNKVAHTHGPDGEHVHDDKAFTIWLDPTLASDQANAIHAGLSQLLPESAATLDANLAELLAGLDTLDRQLATVFAKVADRQVIYSHPVYQYLNRRYALEGVNVHWEPGAMPRKQAIETLEQYAGGIMLWEAEPLPELRDQLESMNIRPVVFATAATAPASGDYFDIMRANVQRLEATLP